MTWPVLLVVADDGRVVDGLAGDLERRFGADYRVQAERSPAARIAAPERLGGGGLPTRPGGGAGAGWSRWPWWWRPGGWRGPTGWGCWSGPTSSTRGPSGSCSSTGASG